MACTLIIKIIADLGGVNLGRANMYLGGGKWLSTQPHIDASLDFEMLMCAYICLVFAKDDVAQVVIAMEAVITLELMPDFPMPLSFYMLE